MGRQVKCSENFAFKRNVYESIYDWPEDCNLQSGTSGIVFERKKGGSYRTAFFEAFPRDPDTFIRGEGKDLGEAENDAWRQFQKNSMCKGHEFEKRGYNNGGGFCKHCNMFKGKAFEPWEDCKGGCGKKTYYSRDKNDDPWCEDCRPNIPDEFKSEGMKMWDEIGEELEKERKEFMARMEEAK